MDKNHGYVKIYRSITDWGWYKNRNTASVFFHCIIKANFEDREWMGVKIPRGSFVTSLKNLSKELKISVGEVRTALKHLKITHEITCKATGQYTIITVNKYNAYQQNPTQNYKQFTNASQTLNKQITNESQQLNKGRIEERKKGRRGAELNHIFDELEEELKQ